MLQRALTPWFAVLIFLINQTWYKILVRRLAHAAFIFNSFLTNQHSGDLV